MLVIGGHSSVCVDQNRPVVISWIKLKDVLSVCVEQNRAVLISWIKLIDVLSVCHLNAVIRNSCLYVHKSCAFNRSGLLSGWITTITLNMLPGAVLVLGSWPVRY